MASFPRLSTGAIAQYPSDVQVESFIGILQYVDGSEQRFRERANTSRQWTLRMDHITEEEMSSIEEFFVAQQGRFGQFSFTDPWTGIEYPDCSFTEDSLRSQLFGEEWAGTTIVIRTND